MWVLGWVRDSSQQQLSLVKFTASPAVLVLLSFCCCSGDTRGRRLTLLLSIVFMAVPTVLIGCLPTYAHIGVAAPVLLSLLRLVQGLAMGGEFGSALVSLVHTFGGRGRGGGACTQWQPHCCCRCCAWFKDWPCEESLAVPWQVCAHRGRVAHACTATAEAVLLSCCPWC